VDRNEYSAIAHSAMAFCNPLNEIRVDDLIGKLGLPPNASVLDSGCGKAEMLIRIVERYYARGVGIDLSPQFVAEARARIAKHIPQGDITIHEMDIAGFVVAPASLDLVICVGSTHLYGDFRGTLRALTPLLRPSGQLLIGDAYWKRPPTAEYLALLGATEDEMNDYVGNVNAAIEAGLIPLYVVDSDQIDWDRYEWSYNLAIERYIAAHPDEPDIDGLRQWGHAVRGRYLGGGRDILGFALYLLQA